MAATTPPREFDSYWATLLEELNELPIAPEVTLMPLRSDEHTTCYGVRLTSWGAYRIFGYLCIPTSGNGPFPAHYFLPRYQSVMEVVTQGDSVDKRRQCVTFSIACRGQRNADRPLAGEFPGMLTTGVEDPQNYPLRGWVADCVRGLQYVLTRPEVDPRRIAGVGYNDFSLLTAALQPGLCCVTSVPGLFHRCQELHPLRSAYPLEETNDYARCYPDRAAQLYETLNLFDPLWFAPRMSVPALLWSKAPFGLCPTEAVRKLAEEIGPHAQVRESAGSKSLDGVAQEVWVAEKLGLAQAVLPEHWRSD